VQSNAAGTHSDKGYRTYQHALALAKSQVLKLTDTGQHQEGLPGGTPVPEVTHEAVGKCKVLLPI